ncbi:MAG: hypothetical protein FWF75_00990 [Propionibacteriaceae bacterium]|nr:hypothetical protein [Propionibacteriaceae bacterium]
MVEVNHHGQAATSRFEYTATGVWPCLFGFVINALLMMMAVHRSVPALVAQAGDVFAGQLNDPDLMRGAVSVGAFLGGLLRCAFLLVILLIVRWLEKKSKIMLVDGRSWWQSSWVFITVIVNVTCASCIRLILGYSVWSVEHGIFVIPLVLAITGAVAVRAQIRRTSGRRRANIGMLSAGALALVASLV